MMPGWGEGNPIGWGGMLFGPIFMIALIVVTVLIVAWALRAAGFSSRPRGEADDALTVLKMRLARGDIDQKEYDERRKLLNS